MITTLKDGQNLGRSFVGILRDTLGNLTTRDFVESSSELDLRSNCCGIDGIGML